LFVTFVKDVINLLLGDDEGMTFGDRADVEESVELIVLCYFITGNLTSDDT
jgi:hypothetical protein